LLVVEFITIKILNPVEVVRDALLGMSKAAVLAAGKDTAGIPQILLRLNALPPTFEVVFPPRPLLSIQIPLANEVVVLESAASNHVEHPAILVGEKPDATGSGIFHF
jgi:hypothetical protein